MMADEVDIDRHVRYNSFKTCKPSDQQIKFALSHGNVRPRITEASLACDRRERIIAEAVVRPGAAPDGSNGGWPPEN